MRRVRLNLRRGQAVFRDLPAGTIRAYTSVHRSSQSGVRSLARSRLIKFKVVDRSSRGSPPPSPSATATVSPSSSPASTVPVPTPSAISTIAATASPPVTSTATSTATTVPTGGCYCNAGIHTNSNGNSDPSSSVHRRIPPRSTVI